MYVCSYTFSYRLTFTTIEYKIYQIIYLQAFYNLHVQNKFKLKFTERTKIIYIHPNI